MNQQSASFSSVLQKLSNDHFNRLIGVAEYRAKRREILDQIDRYYNGNDVRKVTEPKKDDTTTVPNQHSLGTTMTFSVDEILGSNDPSNKVDFHDPDKDK